MITFLTPPPSIFHGARHPEAAAPGSGGSGACRRASRPRCGPARNWAAPSSPASRETWAGCSLHSDLWDLRPHTDGTARDDQRAAPVFVPGRGPHRHSYGVQRGGRPPRTRPLPPSRGCPRNRGKTNAGLLQPSSPLPANGTRDCGGSGRTRPCGPVARRGGPDVGGLGPPAGAR